MATKIRLQRHGRKGYAFYKIVVADSRAPRDGKFIEKIGTYNPNTNPATVDLKFERALYWLNTGAQPTETVRNLLSREGVLLMKHLQGGIKKGAFDEAQAQSKFEAWSKERDAKLGRVSESVKAARLAASKLALEAEQEANKAKAQLVAEKRKAQAEAEALANAPEETAEEAAPEAEASTEETSAE